MKTKSAMILVTAGMMMAACVPAAHAYANMEFGQLKAGQWHAKPLSLSSSPSAQTMVRASVKCHWTQAAPPPADFDLYLMDQWGNCLAMSTNSGPDSISQMVTGTHCTLVIVCRVGQGPYECTIIVENSPTPPATPYRFRASSVLSGVQPALLRAR